MNHLLFQYCPKIAVFSTERDSVLLCKRKGEADYDEVFSFIGGKMEVTDSSILAAVQREKTEEVGTDFKINLSLEYSVNVFFRKKDGSSMILPHFYAEYVGDQINLSDEYAEHKWVLLAELDAFEPKISNIPAITRQLALARAVVSDEDLSLI